MTEDDLLDGITEALTLAGWRWTHHRRSDKALMMGDGGLPDIIACHPVRGTMLVLELKTATGRHQPGQREWLAAFRACGIDARTIRPDDYDAIVDEIVGDRLVKHWKP